jgi:ariadne-1
VLRHYKYNRDKLETDWFDHNEKIKKESGILVEAIGAETLKHSMKIQQGMCSICCEDLNEHNKIFLVCHHEFCKDCFRQYLETQVSCLILA